MAEVDVEDILPLKNLIADMSDKAFTVYNKTTGQAFGLNGQVLIDLDAAKVDKVTGKGLSANDYTTAEKNKLTGVAENANDYTHPANHAPAIITQDTSNRFVTDAQISAWNAKQAAGSYEVNTNKSNDISTDAASTTKYPSVKAFKDYADGLVVGLIDDRGNYNASGNTFPATGGSGTAGAILKGDIWFISVIGTLGGVAVGVGQSVRALVDTPGQTASNWSIIGAGLGYVPENTANKKTSITDSDTDFPTGKAVTAALLLKSNDNAVVKLTGAQTVQGVKTFESSPIIPTPTTDMQASTKKYVDDGLGNKINTSVVKQVPGVSETDLMSQKSITDLVNYTLECVIIARNIIDPAIYLATGDAQATWLVTQEFNGMSLLRVVASVAVASSSGLPTFQVRNVTTGFHMLSTPVTIDATETNSLTALTPAVINAAYKVLTTGDLIAFDCDVAGTGTKGWDITISIAP